MLSGRRSGGPARAVYARLLDGATLWLAVRTAATELTLRTGEDELGMPVEMATDDRGVLATTRFRLLEALTGYAEDPLIATVHAGAGRRATPILSPPELGSGPLLPAPTPSHDRWRLTLEDDGGALRILRRTAEPAVTVTGITESVNGVELGLAVPPGGRGEVAVVAGGATVATFRATRKGRGASVLLPAATALRVEGTATVELDGLPVVRRANVLAKPHQAVALPQLGEDVELRWQVGGRLVLRRHGAEVS